MLKEIEAEVFNLLPEKVVDFLDSYYTILRLEEKEVKYVIDWDGISIFYRVRKFSRAGFHIRFDYHNNKFNNITMDISLNTRDYIPGGFKGELMNRNLIYTRSSLVASDYRVYLDNIEQMLIAYRVFKKYLWGDLWWENRE